MTKRSKRAREMATLVNKEKSYLLGEAIDILKKCPQVKFDQSVELALMTSVDTRKSDQQVRGTVSLPNGTGKRITVAVVAKGDKLKEAEAAGADVVGSEDLIEKMKEGWTGFDVLITTPDMMREVGKLGKVLGPRGLMPTPKAGTVATDVAKAISEMKAGKVEFKVDKTGVVNNLVGKLSFETGKLVQNIETFLLAVSKAKPASAKGHFLKSLWISSTMGPGLRIDLNAITVVKGERE